MKYAPTYSKSPRQDTSGSTRRPSADSHGIAIAPPAYGIDFVDHQRATDKEASSPPQSPTNQQMPEPVRRSAHPTALLQRASATPGSLTRTETLSLQRTIGNRALGRLMRGGLPTPIGAERRHDEREKQHASGLPDRLKDGVETLSGVLLDDVTVHYNSPQPAQVQALAYTQGSDIHVAPGQEQHLPHEAWHVVQQAKGRVKPTIQLKDGVPVNDDAGLEHEADAMGAKALTPAAQLIGAPMNGTFLTETLATEEVAQREHTLLETFNQSPQETIQRKKTGALAYMQDEAIISIIQKTNPNLASKMFKIREALNDTFKEEFPTIKSLTDKFNLNPPHDQDEVKVAITSKPPKLNLGKQIVTSTPEKTSVIPEKTEKSLPQPIIKSSPQEKSEVETKATSKPIKLTISKQIATNTPEKSPVIPQKIENKPQKPFLTEFQKANRQDFVEKLNMDVKLNLYPKVKSKKTMDDFNELNEQSETWAQLWKQVGELMGDAKSPDEIINSEHLDEIVQLTETLRMTYSGQYQKRKAEFMHFEQKFISQKRVLTDALSQRVEYIEQKKLKEKEALEAINERERMLGEAALEKLGDLSSENIGRWLEQLKKFEAQDSFAIAFQANRMTARQISTSGRGGNFKVRSTKKGKEREIKLARDVPGVKERFIPTNFFNTSDPNAKSKKNEKGLHDLSASLLDRERPISEQLKHYEGAIVLFMPLPMEDDLRIFSALTRKLGTGNPEVRKIRSMFTRVKLAQASDMGTSFVDISDPSAKEGKFRYGITGTIIRRKGGIGVAAKESELAARRTNALQYTNILKEGITRVNEVVMAYREHASKDFPMFAELDKGGFYNILDVETLTPTGKTLSNDGKVR